MGLILYTCIVFSLEWHNVITAEKNIAVKVDPDSGIPLWVQLRNRLVYLIESGALSEGDKLPTVREMAVDLGINLNGYIFFSCNHVMPF